MAEYLVIKVTRCTLVLTEQEFIDLLARDPELYRQAVKRGKGQLRFQQRIKRRRSTE